MWVEVGEYLSYIEGETKILIYGGRTDNFLHRRNLPINLIGISTLWT